jgi:hypothetical protein
MITKPISNVLHYTLFFYNSLSLMKTIIISKFYLWINLWITMCFVCKNPGYQSSLVGVLCAYPTYLPMCLY